MSLRTSNHGWLLRKCAVVAMAGLAVSPAFAIDYASAADGSWTTPATWNPVGTPTSADNVTITHNVTLPAAAMEANDVTLNGGTLVGTGAGTLSIHGDLDNNGGLNDFVMGTVTFAGSGFQAITGPLQFSALTIANTDPSPSDLSAVLCSSAVTATSSLTVDSGQFMPASGSQFLRANLTGGILKPIPGATITLTGAVGNVAFNKSAGATFTHNNSRFVFAGDTRQTVTFGGTAPTFYNVDAANTAAAPNSTDTVQLDANVANNLRVLDGQCNLATRDYRNVEIAAGAILEMSGSPNIQGDWTNGGTFTPAGVTVTFNGTGRQEITGATTFSHLAINNSAASPDDTNAVVCNSPVATTGALNVSAGQFMPADGSQFVRVNLSGGIFKPAPGAVITLPGAMIDVAFDKGAAATFTHNNSRFVFSGAVRQNVIFGGSLPIFYDVDAANTADTVELDAYVANDLRILSGQCNLNGYNYGTVELSAGATLQLDGPPFVQGDWIDNGGTFLPGAYSVVFSGTGRQEIIGATAFNGLTISNTAVVPSDTDAVVPMNPINATGTLTVNSGQFMPPDGSQFLRLNLFGGILKPEPNAVITVTGAVSDSAFNLSGATFTHNNSRFVFAGNARQNVTGSALFYDVDVANTAADPSTTNAVRLLANVANTLRVLDGRCNNIAPTTLGNVELAADGILDLQNSLNIQGDWTNNGGTFIPNAHAVNFTGTGRQEISGATTFNALTINNTAGTPSDTDAVVCNSPVIATGSLTLTAGQFMPADGSQFLRAALNGGILKPEANAVITLTGAVSNVAFNKGASATFTHNNSRFVFAGSARQVVSSVGAPPIFYDVDAANTAAVPNSTNAVLLDAEIANNVRVLDGQCNLGAYSYGNLEISPGTIIELTGVPRIRGNWTDNGGTLVHSNQEVAFAGTARQEITGATSFHSISVSNTAATPNDTNAVVAMNAITASATLSVMGGQFMPADGSQFLRANLTGGILKPEANAVITLTGAVSNVAFNKGASATFTHNNSRFVFAGSARQTVTFAGSAPAFYDVDAANTAAVPNSTNAVLLDASVANNLRVLDGQCNIATHDYGTVEISAGAILELGGSPNIQGDWTHSGGTFTPGLNTVSFTGTGRQEITGATAFHSITINNSAVTPSDTDAVVSMSAITTADTLTITNGQFMPATGSEFRDIALNGGFLKPAASAVITITGVRTGDMAFSQSGAGSLVHNDSRFVLDSNALQLLTAATGAQFHQLDVLNTAASPDATNETRLGTGVSVLDRLHVLDGQCAIGGASFGDVQVEADGLLRLAAAVNIAGDLSNDGALDVAGSHVTFDGATIQQISSTNALALADVTVAAGTTLDQVGATDNISVLGTLTNLGTLRRTHAVSAAGPLGGGLTGATVDLTTQGTVASLTIDRIESVPNATGEHTDPVSWTFDLAGGTGYEATLTLPHNIADPVRARLSRYTGSDWTSDADSATATTATLAGITTLDGLWAMLDDASASVDGWMLLSY